MYQSQVPSCIPDAFTALSSYHSRTPATEEFIYRILESRAESLIAGQDKPESELDCFDHVSRLQALIVYSSTRFFDSDIR